MGLIGGAYGSVRRTVLAGAGQLCQLYLKVIVAWEQASRPG